MFSRLYVTVPEGDEAQTQLEGLLSTIKATLQKLQANGPPELMTPRAMDTPVADRGALEVNPLKEEAGVIQEG